MNNRVVIYTRNVLTCYKSLELLELNDVKYVKKDLDSVVLVKEEIEKLIKMTEDSVFELFKRNVIADDQSIEIINDMKLSELVNFILDNPGVLREPISVSPKRMIVGYNEEDYKGFINRVKLDWSRKQ